MDTLLLLELGGSLEEYSFFTANERSEVCLVEGTEQFVNDCFPVTVSPIDVVPEKYLPLNIYHYKTILQTSFKYYHPLNITVPITKPVA